MIMPTIAPILAEMGKGTSILTADLHINDFVSYMFANRPITGDKLQTIQVRFDMFLAHRT